MKDYVGRILICIAIIVGSLIIAASVIRGAKIVGEIIVKSKEAVVSEKQVADLVKKALNEERLRIQREMAEEAKKREPGARKIEGVAVGSNPLKGNPEAKVLMVEFSDFQCPYSKRFYKQIFPQIEKEYIATGKVKAVYRDYPLSIHTQAKGAAAAARCAARQSKFWEMRDKLSNSDTLDNESIKEYAQEVGLNSAKFNECLDTPEVTAEVEKEISEAEKIGVESTPSLFINGRLIEGAYPFEVFKKIIEEELAKAENK